MINYRQITQFIIKTINESTDIRQYVQNTYNKEIKIFVGANTEDPPGKDEMPLLLIEPIIKNIGNAEVNFNYEMLLKVALVGFDKPKVEDNVIIYDGIYEVEELGGLVVEALRKAFGKKSNLDTYDIDFYHDEINAFPIYTGTITIGFNVPNVLGCEKIEFQGE